MDIQKVPIALSPVCGEQEEEIKVLDEQKEMKSKIKVQNRGILRVWATTNAKMTRWTRQAGKSEVRRVANHYARVVMDEKRAEMKRVKVQMNRCGTSTNTTKISLSVGCATNGIQGATL